MAQSPKQLANLKPIKKGELSTEEARRRGRAGGKKTAEVMAKRRDAKKAIRYILELNAEGNVKQNLEALGIPEDEQSNMVAVWAKTFADWLRTGDVKLLEIMMKYAGFDEAELRKARESDARIRAMDKSGIPVAGETDTNRNEIMIVLPDDQRGAPGAVEISESDAERLLDRPIE